MGGGERRWIDPRFAPGSTRKSGFLQILPQNRGGNGARRHFNPENARKQGFSHFSPQKSGGKRDLLRFGPQNPAEIGIFPCFAPKRRRGRALPLHFAPQNSAEKGIHPAFAPKMTRKWRFSRVLPQKGGGGGAQCHFVPRFPSFHPKTARKWGFFAPKFRRNGDFSLFSPQNYTEMGIFALFTQKYTKL